MSYRLIADFFNRDATCLSTEAWRAVVVLAYLGDDDGLSYPTDEVVAERAALGTPKNARRIIGRLTDLGLYVPTGEKRNGWDVCRLDLSPLPERRALP